MDIADALQIVIDLASQGVIDARDNETENRRQLDAIAVITDLAVNQFGDD